MSHDHPRGLVWFLFTRLRAVDSITCSPSYTPLPRGLNVNIVLPCRTTISRECYAASLSFTRLTRSNILPLTIRRPRRPSVSQPLSSSPSTCALSFSCPLQPIHCVSRCFHPHTLPTLCSYSTPQPLLPFPSALIPRTLSTPLAWTLKPDCLRPPSPLWTRSDGVLRSSCRAEAEVWIRGYWRARAGCCAEDDDAHLTASMSVEQGDLRDRKCWLC